MKYAAAIIIDMRKQSIQATDPITMEQGQKYMISVKKNHVTPRIFPYVKVPHYIIYGEGTEVILSTLQKAIDQKIVKQAGPWLLWPEKDIKIQGKGNFRAFLKDNPDILQELMNIVQDDIQELTAEEMKELDINPEAEASQEEAIKEELALSEISEEDLL